jgi:hypothetical protein
MKNQPSPPPAAKILPPDYQPLYTLDLKNNFRVAMSLNLAVLFMFFVWGYFFIRISEILRSSTWLGEQTFLTEIGLIHVVVVFIVMILLHEGIHGLFFWIFTRERPKFGFKLFYAYAAAPEWYIPRNKYIWIGLAPLILVSIVGVAIIPWVPILWLSGLILFLTVNAAGSMGDAFIILVTLSQPKDILIQDLGDSFTIYGRSSA